MNGWMIAAIGLGIVVVVLIVAVIRWFIALGNGMGNL